MIDSNDMAYNVAPSNSQDQRQPFEHTDSFQIPKDIHGVQDSIFTADAGEGMIAILLDNISDPLTLFQLSSASAQAKHAFEYQPLAYLKQIMSSLQPDLSQLMIAYIAVIIGEVPSVDQPTHEHSSKIKLFIDKYLGSSPPPLPERLSNPVLVVKEMADVAAAIEQLSISSSDFWAKMTVAYKDMSRKDWLQKIRLTLWRFEIFCSLFKHVCPLGVLRDSSGGRDKLKECHIRHEVKMSQYRFFLALDQDGVWDLARVYDDLSKMLELTYASCLALMFEQGFRKRTVMLGSSRSKILLQANCWDSSYEASMFRKAVGNFMGYIDYRMSLGLRFLCHVNKERSRHVVPIDPLDYTCNDKWTMSFREAMNDNVGGYMCSGGEYCLRPVRKRSLRSSESGSGQNMSWTSMNSNSRLGLELEIKYYHDDQGRSERRIKQPILLDWNPNDYVDHTGQDDLHLSF